MNNLKENKTVKYAIFCFAFIFIVTGTFSSIKAQFTDPNTVFFPNDQFVTGPNFFPFSNSQGVIDIFNQNGCQNPVFLFDGPDSLFSSTLEVGPAGNGFETGSRNILIFDMDGNALFDGAGFPVINPNTMNAFDPSMGDILGLSIVPGSGFPSSATFMITTTVNCDNGTSTSTSSSTSSSSSGSVTVASSSGSGLTDGELIDRAISLERSAKSFINVKDLINGMDSSFSVSMALDALMSSDSDLKELQNRFGDNNIMIGMSSIQTKLGDAIDNDSEASMILDPLKNTPPSPSDGELTTGVTKAKKLINEAIASKNLVKRKLDKIEKSDKKK